MEARALRGLLVIAACGLAVGGASIIWLGPPRAAAKPATSARPYVTPPLHSSITGHRELGTASIDNQVFPAPRLAPIEVGLMQMLIGAGMEISRVDCLGSECLALRVFDRSGGMVVGLAPSARPPTCSEARSAARENGMIAGGDPIDTGLTLLVGRRGPFIVETLDARLWAKLRGTFSGTC